MLYIVTGATGHLGNTLIKTLANAGEKVRAFVLDKESTAMLDQYPIEIYRGNVLNLDSLRELLNLSNTEYTYEDICLIHTAGIISISSRENKGMYNVNVNGTKNILYLAKELGIGHLIYISSVHAITEPKEDVVIKESLVFDPETVVGSYAKTKAEATRLVTEAYLEGYPITIIHPSGIIGPFDYGSAHMSTMMINYFNNKLNARIDGMYDFVDVRDIAEAIYKASQKKAYGHYLITGHQIQLKGFFAIMQDIAGRKYKAVVFTHAFIKIFLPLLEYVARKNKKPPLFTRYSLYTLISHSNFSYEKATRDLDYVPRPIYDTIRDNALWLVGQKKINHKKTAKYILRKFLPLYL